MGKHKSSEKYEDGDDEKSGRSIISDGIAMTKSGKTFQIKKRPQKKISTSVPTTTFMALYVVQNSPSNKRAKKKKTCTVGIWWASKIGYSHQSRPVVAQHA